MDSRKNSCCKGIIQVLGEGERKYMEHKKVTAVITTYKRDWRTVERALNSILGQTVKPYEIFIVDDNNPDTEFSRIIRENAIKIPEVTYISTETNVGVARARNIAVEKAGGDCIAFLDDDDEWTSYKIEKLVSMFDFNPHLGIAFGTAIIVYDDTDERERNWQYLVFNDRPTYKDMLANDYVGSASAVMLSVKAVKEAGGFRAVKQPAVEDYELWIRIAAIYDIQGTKNVVFIKHMDSKEHVSTNNKRVFLGFKNIYEIHRDEYEKLPYARKCILYNVGRYAFRAKTLKGIPYVMKWLSTVIYIRRTKGKRRK